VLVDCQLPYAKQGWASAKLNAGKHPLEHGSERLVGIVLVHPGPSEQCGPADVDDGQAEEEIGLRSEAALGSVGIAFGAAEGPSRKPSGWLASMVLVTFISVAGRPSTVILVISESSALSLV
jgi:hypothetical protein